MFEGICETLHHELDLLEDKFQDGNAMTREDLDMIDKMFHALKCKKTYEAMIEHEDEGSYAKIKRYRKY